MVSAVKRVLILILITIPLVLSTYSEDAEIFAELATYSLCRNESTGVAKVIEKMFPEVTKCSSAGTFSPTKQSKQNTNCLKRCTFVKLKFINEFTFEFDEKETDVFIEKNCEKYSGANELRRLSYECYRANKYSTDDECRTTVVAVECFRKAFKEVCGESTSAVVEKNHKPGKVVTGRFF